MMVWLNAGIVVLYAGVAASIIEGMDVRLFVIPGAVLILVGVVAGFVKMFRA